MKSYRLLGFLLSLVLTACVGFNEQGTLAELRNIRFEPKDVKIEGGIEKAMQSYQRFLAQTPESAMTPEAIRRLADLKMERENEKLDVIAGAAPVSARTKPAIPVPGASVSKTATGLIGATSVSGARNNGKSGSNMIAAVSDESDNEFEKRATATPQIQSSAKGETSLADGSSADMNNVGAKEAVALYKQLLRRFPMYERNDQVLYQMSRAYEEMGEPDKAMKAMNRIVKEYPNSRYIDEVQFRRAEYYFIRKKFLDSEDAYKAIVKNGKSSSYFELALYKLGWTFYKQQMYEEAVPFFMALLDHKVSVGYDFEQTSNKIEKKRIDDTYRVVSLSFSNMNGAESIADHFEKVGRKPYEIGVYSNLAEHYLAKRRYSDAAGTYNAYVKRNPFNKVSPHFHMRVVEIYKEGRFPKLVVEAKRSFASAYGLKSEYWKHFDLKSYPKVIAHLQTNITDLAVHYHAMYRNRSFASKKKEHYAEASRWYLEFLSSFPNDGKTPKMHFQYAELLLQGKQFGDAGREYERVAYNYPPHEKSSASGYAAVYAFRENLKVAVEAEIPVARQEVIRSSLKFADAFPEHEKAAIVLAAVADDLFEMKDYGSAMSTAKKMIDNYPDAKKELRRSAWTIVAHSSYETARYAEAEGAYTNVLALTGSNPEDRNGLLNNLAASIYKQGEAANKLQDYKTAAGHFLRISKVAPDSTIRKTAEFDGAAVLIKLNDWPRAAAVLVSFRNTFNDQKMQREATKKLAVVYQQAERYAEAAVEFERIERESKDDDVRREALILAAQMHEKTENHKRALMVYQRYVDAFPKPLEYALETRYKMAQLYKSWGNDKRHLRELRRVISIDATAGAERTDRTRYLAGKSSLVLVEPAYKKFISIKLNRPFKRNLKRKKNAMKAAIAGLNKLVKFQVGDVTAGATYYMAEIYYNFSRSLAESERPGKLNKLEMEQYELALEEQIFPFEEKAIAMHRKNLELVSVGVYSLWIDKSLERLGSLMPARYGKFEQSTGFILSMDSYQYKFKATTFKSAQADTEL
ncbi:MAG: tetratricopeptide repeat protein [Zetaproteobacteria bacterium]|nr:MAG: tetratricopeptide repeat protein [Zetaproteobacteria bacterium]